MGSGSTACVLLPAPSPGFYEQGVLQKVRLHLEVLRDLTPRPVQRREGSRPNRQPLLGSVACKS